MPGFLRIADDKAYPMSEEVMIGIDVGGPAKGFHVVAICHAEIIGTLRSHSAVEVAAWCLDRGSAVVAVDAPCLWRGVGRPARAAERQLAQDGISSFSTPTEAAARGHPFYTWMFAGMEIFRALATSHPLYLGQADPRNVTLETFPQAVACALAGQIVSAKEKNRGRRGLLTRAGIDESKLGNIDEVDAALCALAAQSFSQRSFHAYGDREGGYIVVPAWSRRARTRSATAP
jgi:predicted RNase H-like nuclease